MVDLILYDDNNDILDNMNMFLFAGLLSTLTEQTLAITIRLVIPNAIICYMLLLLSLISYDTIIIIIVVLDVNMRIVALKRVVELDALWGEYSTLKFNNYNVYIH